MQFSFLSPLPLPPPPLPPLPSPRQTPLLFLLISTGATIWLRVIDRLNRACIQISNGVCECGCVFGERLKRRHNRHHGQISRLFTSLPARWGSRASSKYRSGTAAPISPPRSSHALAIPCLAVLQKTPTKQRAPEHLAGRSGRGEDWRQNSESRRSMKSDQKLT